MQHCVVGGVTERRGHCLRCQVSERRSVRESRRVRVLVKLGSTEAAFWGGGCRGMRVDV